jgi:regulator of protease activity HflC (stomatin/prohibitin superfamily)
MSTNYGITRPTNGTPGTPATNGVGCFLFIVLVLIGAAITAMLLSSVPLGAKLDYTLPRFAPLIISLIIGWLVYLSLRIARQWERAIVLRLGHYSRTAGPGIFFLTPLIDSISTMVDTRIQLTSFKAEQTLSRDTVPVDVDAVLFWFVNNPKQASLEVSNYADAVNWASQTALRDTIGRTDLAALLAGREQIEVTLKQMIDARTQPWGVTVQSVEMRDVIIPVALQDAMSKEAQAQRERHARVILSQAEIEVAQKFNEAANIYASNPAAMSLRSMNLLADAVRERGALVIVPNNAVETLGLGTISGLSALAQGNLVPNAPKEPDPSFNTGLKAPPAAPSSASNQQRPPQNPNNPQPYSPWPNPNGQGHP